MQCLRFDTAWKHTICLWLRFTSGWRMRLGWCPSWKCLGPAGALNWSPFIHKHEVITTHKCKMAKVAVSTPWCAFKVKTLQRKSYRSYLSLSLLQIKGSQSGEPSSPSEFTFLEDLCWQEEEMHWPVWPKVRVGMGSLSWGSRDTHTVSGAEERCCSLLTCRGEHRSLQGNLNQWKDHAGIRLQGSLHQWPQGTVVSISTDKWRSCNFWSYILTSRLVYEYKGSTAFERQNQRIGRLGRQPN